MRGGEEDGREEEEARPDTAATAEPPTERAY